MKNFVKICIIGCGGMAEYYHGPAILNYVYKHNNVELRACCDLDMIKAEKFRSAFKFKKAYTDYQLMLDEINPDGVFLFVPVDITARIAIHTLERGIPIMTEKPPGMTCAENQAMNIAAEKGNTFAFTAFNRRFTPPVIYLNHKLEELEGLPIDYIRYDFHRVGRTDPDFSTTAIHAIDTTKFLANSRYSKLWAEYQPKVTINNEKYNNTFMSGIFNSGTRFEINICPMAGINIEQVTLVLEKHTFIINIPLYSHFSQHFAYQHFVNGILSGSKSGIELANSEEDFILGGFFNEAKTFIECLLRNNDTQIETHHIKTGNQSVAIMQALREEKEYIEF